ncbi:MAG: hypothetical protein ACT60Q_01020 [Ferrovibrionaceae bacterium]
MTDRHQQIDLDEAAARVAKALDELETRPRGVRSPAARLIASSADRIKSARDRGHSYADIARTMTEATGIRITDKNIRRVLNDLIKRASAT